MPPARQVVAPAKAGLSASYCNLRIPACAALARNDGVRGAGFISTIPSQRLFARM